MTYIKTTLKREIAIDSIITIHYFEYMKNFMDTLTEWIIPAEILRPTLLLCPL